MAVVEALPSIGTGMGRYCFQASPVRQSVSPEKFVKCFFIFSPYNVYYAAVLLGRVSGRARPSPSVCLTRVGS